MTLLNINNLSVKNRLKPLSLTLNYGERLHLIGPNGAGKSTLLFAIANSISFQGTVYLNETSITDYKYCELSRIIGFVIQQSEALPFMSVFHYLSLFHQQSKMKTDTLQSLLSDFHIDKLLSKNIHHLSGGEWQRIRIIAIFIQLWSEDNLTGKLMLLDEPANNLDIVQLAILDNWLDKFCQQGGSIIMSTHDLNHTYQKADKIALISDGILNKFGEPTLLLDESLLSATFNNKIQCINKQSVVHWQVI